MTHPSDHGEHTSSGWTNPGGWGTPPEGGYGAPGQPTPGGPPPEGGYGAPSSPPPGPGGFNPHHPPGTFAPVQPGIIPLHPLTLGQIYDGAFKAIRANPMVMFVFAGVVITLTTVIELALSASFLTDYFSL